MRVSAKKLQNFKRDIWKYYSKNKRDFPWRRTKDPYLIVVSEVMLQQTQVLRVVQKFTEFTKRFPTFKSLSLASNSEVLGLWQGMGYNRRALYLKALSKTVENELNGDLPDSPDELVKLPAIGHATAGSIVAFAYNEPTVFVETNIRRVFLHFFFQDKKQVRDKDIIPLVKETVDKDNPREWYWALMDYGTMLVKTIPNPNRKSRHYIKQTPFIGSNREVRGAVIRLILKERSITKKDILTNLPYHSDRLNIALEGLVKEGFLKKDARSYQIQ